MFRQGVFAAAAACVIAGADVVNSNGPIITQSSGTQFTTATLVRSVGFTVPADGPAYRLDEVEVALNFTANVPASVSLWSGVSAPTTFVANLVTALPPVGHFAFPFSPLDRIELAPGTTYWVRVQAGGANPNFTWDGSVLGLLPGGVFPHAGYHSSSGSPGVMRNGVIVHADPILIDNFDAAGAGGDVLQTTPIRQRKSFGWTPGDGQAWLLRTVRLTLSGAGAQPEVRLFRGLSPQFQEAARIAGTINGQADVRVDFEDLDLFMRARERWWMEVSPAGAANLTWVATSPNTVPTGEADSNGYRFGGHPHFTANRLEVIASPLLGINRAPAPDTVRFGESLLAGTHTRLELPPGRTAVVHGVILALTPFTSADDIIAELWEGENTPEQLVGSFPHFEILGAADLQVLYGAHAPIVLAPGEVYWLVLRSRFGNSGVTASTVTEAIAGVLRGGETTSGGSFDGTPRMAILGLGEVLCEADLSGSADPLDDEYGVPDGTVDASDFFFYLDQFGLGNVEIADMTASSDPGHSLYGFPDGTLDSDDFFYYLDRFAAGCP